VQYKVVKFHRLAKENVWSEKWKTDGKKQRKGKKLSL
jgi:hypothetical protein